MLRVKDPKISVKFYEEVIGMKLVHKMDFEENQFSLYFLAYTDKRPPQNESSKFAFNQPGVLELTHNWGTEKDDSFKGYHNGNNEPKGFGHIAITVENIEETCDRLEQLNTKFIKKLSDGNMKNIAFISDPDGYWIEIVSKKFI